MRYRIYMSVAVEAQNDAEAFRHAESLSELLKSPMVRMAVEGNGIQLAPGEQPTVHQPQREIP